MTAKPATSSDQAREGLSSCSNNCKPNHTFVGVTLGTIILEGIDTVLIRWVGHRTAVGAEDKTDRTSNTLWEALVRHASEVVRGIIPKAADYDPAQFKHVQVTNATMHNPGYRFGGVGCYTFACDFSGMDCEAYVLKNAEAHQRLSKYGLVSISNSREISSRPRGQLHDTCDPQRRHARTHPPIKTTSMFMQQGRRANGYPLHGYEKPGTIPEPGSTCKPSSPSRVQSRVLF